jgi:hypothetical protein
MTPLAAFLAFWLPSRPFHEVLRDQVTRARLRSIEAQVASIEALHAADAEREVYDLLKILYEDELANLKEPANAPSAAS